MPQEIYKIICLSTAHIPPETSKSIDENLSRGVWSSTISAFDYGWFVTVPKEEKDCWSTKYPYGMQNVLRYANKHDCSYILLDRDGPVEDDLAIYDW